MVIGRWETSGYWTGVWLKESECAGEGGAGQVQATRFEPKLVLNLKFLGFGGIV